MIFRTITDESTGTIKSIGLFGKSLNEIKRLLSSFKQNGVISTLLNTPLINIDTKAIDRYNTAIKSGIPFEQALATARRTTNAETVALIESFNGLEIQTERVTAVQKASTIASNAATVATKALVAAGNMIAMWAIGKVISLVSDAIDNYVHRLEYAVDAMEEANSSFESLESEVESLNDELETCRDRIKELQALSDAGTISITEQEELDRLKEENAELERNLRLQQEKARLAAIEAADAATSTLTTAD